MPVRAYRYVGPDEVRRSVEGAEPGRAVYSAYDVHDWVARSDEPVDQDGSLAATFVVTPDGVLRLAPRRTEHVACAAGGEVLTAGELFLLDGAVVEATNQSTGYCPEPESWDALENALKRLGVPHPDSFTSAFVFRRCEECRALNVVKEAWFVCDVCGSDLPLVWNCDS
jgi:hypothetical protein